MPTASLVAVDTSLVGPPSATVREAEIDGAISIYDGRTHRVAVLNSTASDVWRLADGEHSLAAIIRLLASAYSVDAEQIYADVEHAVGELRAAGLLAAAP